MVCEKYFLGLAWANQTAEKHPPAEVHPSHDDFNIISIFTLMYYLILAPLYLLSLMPFWLIYRLSDFISFLLEHVLHYRKDVIMKNLSIAFPDKTDKEKKLIVKKFYRNFSDTFLEAIKLLSMSEKKIKERVWFDPSLFKEVYATGKNCQIHLGHTFNWEWANFRAAPESPYHFLGIYMPIGSKPIDRLFKQIRQKTGAIMLPATDIRNAILPYRNTKYMLSLVADQNPGKPARAHWAKFFGRWTPFVAGPEKNARANDTAVLFAKISKPKRGYYNIEMKLASSDPVKMKEGELTLRYIRFLEEGIRQQPEIYLWSHNRWKWEFKEEYAERKIEETGSNTPKDEFSY